MLHAVLWGVLAAGAGKWCELDGRALGRVRPKAWEGATAAEVMCVPDAACEGLTAAALAAIPAEACAGWGGCFSYAHPAAFGGMTAGCFQNLSPTAMFFVGGEQVARIPPAALAGVPASTLELLPFQACGGITPEQLAALHPIAYEGIQPGCLRMLAPATLRAIAPAGVAYLRPEVFNDMPYSTFQHLPAGVLAALAPSQVRFFTSVCAAVNQTTFLLIAGVHGACGALSPRCVEALPVHVFAVALRGDCASQLSLATVRALTPAKVASIPPHVFESFTAAQLATLDPRGCAGLYPAQLSPAVCISLSEACLASIPRPHPCTEVHSVRPGASNASTVLLRGAPPPPSAPAVHRLLLAVVVAAAAAVVGMALLAHTQGGRTRHHPGVLGTEREPLLFSAVQL